MISIPPSQIFELIFVVASEVTSMPCGFVTGKNIFVACLGRMWPAHAWFLIIASVHE